MLEELQLVADAEVAVELPDLVVLDPCPDRPERSRVRLEDVDAGTERRADLAALLPEELPALPQVSRGLEAGSRLEDDDRLAHRRERVRRQLEELAEGRDGVERLLGLG